MTISFQSQQVSLIGMWFVFARKGRRGAGGVARQVLIAAHGENKKFDLTHWKQKRAEIDPAVRWFIGYYLR